MRQGYSDTWRKQVFRVRGLVRAFGRLDNRLQCAEAHFVEMLGKLRATNWRTIPDDPGVYWWYFPRECVTRLRIGELCDVAALNLRASPSGKVCLYHGMAKSLAERVEWHAAQKLGLSALRSGFLSTFRLTLLALNEFDYLRGAAEIDAFMDELEVEWRIFPAEQAALAAEAAELTGPFHYPLNIQNNRKPGLAAFTQHLQAARKAYRQRYLEAWRPAASSLLTDPIPAEARLADAFAGAASVDAAASVAPVVARALEKPVLALISCTKRKASHACAAADLYKPSAGFSYAYRYARLVADKVLILSAKHGIVRPDQILAPYDETLQGSSQAERERWAEMVYPQLRATPEYRDARSIVWLAGEDYRNELLTRVRGDAKRSSVPMLGLRQGEQVSWLKAQVEGRPPPASQGGEAPEIASAPSVRPVGSGASPKGDDFRRALLELKAKAAERGQNRLEITAGELHRIVGGPGGANHRMPVCCSVMRREMRNGDMVVATPPKGAGASLRISYRAR